MSDERSFKNEEVLEKAVDVINQHTALSFDIINDYELRYSNLKGHVLAIYGVDDSTSPVALTPYFDGLTTYNIKDYFEVPTIKTYYIVDITEYTGRDLPSKDADYSVAGFKKSTMPRKVNKQVEIASQLAEEDSEDRFQGILGEQSIKEVIEDKVEEDETSDPIQMFYATGYAGNYEDSFEDDENEDIVNRPKHYNYGDIEVIDYIEQQAKAMYVSGEVPPEAIPHICNAIKYISRFQSKGKPTEDLKKSVFYINRAIEKYDEE